MSDAAKGARAMTLKQNVLTALEHVEKTAQN
jgi:hypothetical protein